MVKLLVSLIIFFIFFEEINVSRKNIVLFFQFKNDNEKINDEKKVVDRK